MEADTEAHHAPVLFYGSEKSNGWLSQMYNSAFKLDDVWYSCNEQFFQAAKAYRFDDQARYKAILGTKDPKNQKKAGRQVKAFVEKRWRNEAYAVVLKATRLKFTISEHGVALKAMLLATGNRPLAEASPTDRIWGIGLSREQALKHTGPWPGQNLLGRALQEVRASLRTDGEEMTPEASRPDSPVSNPEEEQEEEDTAGAGVGILETGLEMEAPSAPAVLPAMTYTGLKVPQLKSLAKKRGLTGYADKRKPDLIEMLQKADIPPQKRLRTFGPPKPDQLLDLSNHTAEQLSKMLQGYDEMEVEDEDPAKLIMRCHQSILNHEYKEPGKAYEEWPTAYLAAELSNRPWGRPFKKVDRSQMIGLLHDHDQFASHWTDP